MKRTRQISVAVLVILFCVIVCALYPVALPALCEKALRFGVFTAIATVSTYLYYKHIKPKTNHGKNI